jgi:hypothetical protein
LIDELVIPTTESVDLWNSIIWNNLSENWMFRRILEKILDAIENFGLHVLSADLKKQRDHPGAGEKVEDSGNDMS